MKKLCELYPEVDSEVEIKRISINSKEIEEGDFIVVKPNGATSSGKKRFTICCLYKNSDFIDDEDVMEEEELDYESDQDEHEPDQLTE